MKSYLKLAGFGNGLPSDKTWYCLVLDNAELQGALDNSFHNGFLESLIASVLGKEWGFIVADVCNKVGQYRLANPKHEGRDLCVMFRVDDCHGFVEISCGTDGCYWVGECLPIKEGPFEFRRIANPGFCVDALPVPDHQFFCKELS